MIYMNIPVYVYTNIIYSIVFILAIISVKYLNLSKYLEKSANIKLVN